jgi:hypothetical protein
MARNTTKTAAKATRIPADYEDFIAKASWKAMDLLEDDYTFDDAVAKVVAGTKWATTPKGAEFVIANSSSLAGAVETASKIPDADQILAIALSALHKDIRADLVDLGIEPDLFA